MTAHDVYRVVLGLVITAGGVLVAIKVPESKWVPMILCCFGCGMINPDLVERLFRGARGVIMGTDSSSSSSSPSDLDDVK